MKSEIFTNSDNDIIIEMTKEKRLNLFDTYSEGYQYTCKLIFKNSLGVILKEITTTEIEIYKFIDCIYNHIEIGDECIFTFNTNIENYTNSIIVISMEQIIHNDLCCFKEFFKVFDMTSEEMIKVLSFDISEYLPIFIDKLYNLYIADSNIESKFLLCPDFILQ